MKRLPTLLLAAFALARLSGTAAADIKGIGDPWIFFPDPYATETGQPTDWNEPDCCSDLYRYMSEIWEAQYAPYTSHTMPGYAPFYWECTQPPVCDPGINDFAEPHECREPRPMTCKQVFAPFNGD